MNTAFLPSLLVLVLGLLQSAQVCAQTDEHRPLATSTTLRFQDILDSTLQQAPEARVAAVREQQALAFADAGRSWLAGRPALVASYLDDGFFDNHGMQELEYGLQLPLWRPGEKADTEQLGEHYQQQANSWQQSVLITLAGRVRTLLTNLVETEQLLAIEQQSTANAQQVHNVTKRLFETGAVARMEVMQSEALLLEQGRREIQATAMFHDAEVVYRITTGLEVRPTQVFNEQQSSATEQTADHPLLQFLQSSIDVANANVRQTEIAAKGSPQLTVGTRRQRADRFQPTIDSLSLSLTVPFGGKAAVASRTTTARMQAVDAEVVYHNTLRELQLALHEAEHELDVTRESLPLAQQQAALSAERQQLTQRAFDAGELTLVPVLSAVEDARQSARDLVLLQQKQQRLIAEYNQALGVLP
jgi:outer membrane protein, heavy metal efflux system